MELFAASCMFWRRGGDVGKQGFNTLKFFPDQPDEMGLWPRGVLPGLAGGGGKPISILSRGRSTVYMPVTLSALCQDGHETQIVRSFW